MATIFAARDSQGTTRYIGDVPRGAACKCFCIICGSALVAKQGEEKEYHFAHAAGTEAPECPSGMANLLRRLVVDEIELGLWVTSPYSELHPIPGMAPLRWSANRSGPLQIANAINGQEACAFVSIEGGHSAAVYVRIGHEQAPVVAQGTQGAVLLVSCPTADGASVRSERDVRKFIREHAVLAWLQLPDIVGLVAAARIEASKLQRERASEAGRRWAATRRTLDSGALTPVQTGRSEEGIAPPATPVPKVAPQWAPGLAPNATVHYRELDDGTKWVYFPTAEKEWRLAPVPARFDGWDEFFPASIAVPDEGGWLRVVSVVGLLMLFNSHARLSRITSDLDEIERLFAQKDSL